MKSEPSQHSNREPSPPKEDVMPSTHRSNTATHRQTDRHRHTESGGLCKDTRTRTYVHTNSHQYKGQANKTNVRKGGGNPCLAPRAAPHRDAYAATRVQGRSYTCKLDAVTHTHTSHGLEVWLCVCVYGRVLCSTTTPRLRLSSLNGPYSDAVNLAAAAETTITAHGCHCCCSRPPLATAPTSQKGASHR